MDIKEAIEQERNNNLMAIENEKTKNSTEILTKQRENLREREKETSECLEKLKISVFECENLCRVLEQNEKALTDDLNTFIPMLRGIAQSSLNDLILKEQAMLTEAWMAVLLIYFAFFLCFFLVFYCCVVFVVCLFVVALFFCVFKRAASSCPSLHSLLHGYIHITHTHTHTHK